MMEDVLQKSIWDGVVLKSGTEKLQGKINDEKEIINSVEY